MLFIYFIANFRWKKDENGKKILNKETNKYILQFVSIRRLDTNAWAIPGVFNYYYYYL